ncbi:TolC family protein, partial [Enterococcus sp. HPCN18]|uniref:TolC family protein n=1 Tax=Enterococcus sp. HPCN18 TaxID=2248751 RepID=UPI000DCC8A21
GGVRDQAVGTNRAVIGVSIPFPIFDTNRGNIVEALRRQDKAEDDARAIELRLRSAVAAARQRYDTALAEVDALQKEILPGAQTA